jgi:hypothetical protein
MRWARWSGTDTTNCELLDCVACTKPIVVHSVGGDAAEAGTGPGSYPLDGNIWHLDCCNPEDKTSGDGWAVLGSLIGWSNNGSSTSPNRWLSAKGLTET